MKILLIPSLLLLLACSQQREIVQVESEAPISSSESSVRLDHSEQVALAYEVLAATQEFSTDSIGYAGATPREVTALRVLLREPDAASMFRKLHATDAIGTQLYALCGLYYTDPDAFVVGVERLRGTPKSITFKTGCFEIPDYSVAQLLDAGAEHAIRLDSPDQTAREWKSESSDRQALAHDIVGGGYPDMFRSGGGYVELPEPVLVREDD